MNGQNKNLDTIFSTLKSIYHDLGANDSHEINQFRWLGLSRSANNDMKVCHSANPESQSLRATSMIGELEAFKDACESSSKLDVGEFLFRFESNLKSYFSEIENCSFSEMALYQQLINSCEARMDSIREYQAWNEHLIKAKKMAMQSA